jgi:predicted DNA-binding protein (MmcQ/YjbR family)
MNAESAREFLLKLPHVVETEQWGGLVFWVGDKAVGGKMFVMMNLDGDQLPIFYPAGQERMVTLLELEGIVPAPYMARIHWVAAERWGVFRNAEWESELRLAHAITYEKLPPRTKAVLALPKAELKKTVAARRALLAERDKAKKEQAAAIKESGGPQEKDRRGEEGRESKQDEPEIERRLRRLRGLRRRVRGS